MVHNNVLILQNQKHKVFHGGRNEELLHLLKEKTQSRLQLAKYLCRFFVVKWFLFARARKPNPVFVLE